MIQFLKLREHSLHNSLIEVVYLGVLYKFVILFVF